MKRVPTAGRHTSIQPLPLTSLPLAMTTIANARAELARAEHELKRMRASVEELEEEEKRKREEESEKRFQAAAHTIADALTQNFTHAYAKLQGKIQKAITQRSFGALRLDARLVATRNEALQPYANGLYMPVWLSGTASLAYVPHGRP